MRATVGAIAILLLSAPAALAAPAIHAHRGGAVLAGEPTFGEETVPAFRNAVREGWWLEWLPQVSREESVDGDHDRDRDRELVHA